MRRNIVIICLILGVFCAVIKFGSIPKEHPSYPDKAGAHVQLYNPEGDNVINASDIIFTLYTSCGPCDIAGKMELRKKNGDIDIGICKEDGTWKVK